MSAAITAEPGPRRHVVADLGGTSLRIGRITAHGSVEAVRRVTTDGIGRPGPGAALRLPLGQPAHPVPHHGAVALSGREQPE
ncbi:hypothetical protein AB0F45_36110, partial [Streptomyces achromogenes]